MDNKSELEARIPIAVMAALKRYLNDGVHPGGFLSAVLRNDLLATYERADLHSREAMPHLMTYLYNYVPARAFGSPEAVEDWTAERRRAMMNAGGNPIS